MAGRRHPVDHRAHRQGNVLPPYGGKSVDWKLTSWPERCD